jgi:hypothetical protein
VPKLTDRLLQSLKVPPGAKDRLLFDSECPGLGVRVTAAGSRVFIVQWHDRATGKKKREAIGVWGSITIAAAREAARAILGDAARGHDRVADRERQKAAADASREEARLTLERLIVEWADKHLSQRRPGYSREAQRALRLAFKDDLRKPAAHLSRARVIAVLDGLAERGATIAGRTMAYGRSMYAWAVKREAVKENPFHRLPINAATSERDRVLADHELADIREAAATLPFPWGPFYLMALFTLQRREEVAGMSRSELAPDLSLWTVAASRMKNDRAHDVHLSKPARDVLRSVPTIEGQELVFSTNGRTPVSGFSKAKRTLDAKIVELRNERARRDGTKPAPLVQWQLHDFRRAGVSKLAELGVDSIVADRLLAHRPTKLKGAARTYQRFEFMEERKRALNAWAAYLTGSRDGGATVLPFARPGA